MLHFFYIIESSITFYVIKGGENEEEIYSFSSCITMIFSLAGCKDSSSGTAEEAKVLFDYAEEVAAYDAKR